MFVAKVRHTVADRPRPRGRVIPGRRAAVVAVAAAVACLAPLAGWAAEARADRWVPVDRTSWVEQGPIAVSVKVEGRGAPLYQRADREDRWYLEAREGGRYEVTVRNLTGERVGFVISVDGLNAINGLMSHLGSDEPMYVLDPYASTTVKGWRKDLRNVSRFVFVDENRSYAARTDQANGDLGWIRVVAYNEFHPVAWGGGRDWGRMRSNYRDGGPSAPLPVPAPESNAPLRGEANGVAPQGQGVMGGTDMAPLARRDAAPSSPGTGWGENKRDRVREVEFTPERYAAAHVILRYEYRDALERLGVLPWYDRGRDRLEEREEGRLGFAQPPRW